MKPVIDFGERRTSADDVFDHLRTQIGTLALSPGDKVSEADIATQFGISRQPVRDAFSRLSSLGLLLVRPQRATTVRGFSLRAIALARFVRLSLELEVATCAVANWTSQHLPAFEDNIAQQLVALQAEDADQFHTCDAEFHRLLADVAQHPDAFEVILEKRSQIDRLCTLSLTDQTHMRLLVSDHEAMLDALKDRDLSALHRSLRLHLSRLDDTVAEIHAQHAGYFED